MLQSEKNANNVLFLQENKNSIMGIQWTFYPPNRRIGTLDYPPNLNKIKITRKLKNTSLKLSSKNH